METSSPETKKLRIDREAAGSANGHGEELTCRRFGTPEGCPFGDRCRFRHGPSDERFANAGERKGKPCTKFFSTAGCPYGEGCHFEHYVPGGVGAVAQTTSSSAAAMVPAAGFRSKDSSEQGGGTGGYKTRLCNTFNTSEGCRFGDRCNFAHGESDLRRPQLDSRRSLAFPDARGPARPGERAGPYADASSQRSAGPPRGGWRGAAAPDLAFTYGLQIEPTPPGVVSQGGTRTAKMTIDAGVVGAIIGKGGANVKQVISVTGARVAVRDNDDQAKKTVEIEGSLEQIEQAARMVRQFLHEREAGLHSAAAGAAPRSASGSTAGNLGSHNYKTRLCQRFQQGTCTFGERCHFAHGAPELR